MKVSERYKEGIEVPPLRMRSLPIYRGYPVPWFVAWLNESEPEFRAMDPQKFKRAVRDRLCWVCGGHLGRWVTFVIGPMCGINRTSSEPPSHLDCARYSARNCPFLSKPQMNRRENDLPEDVHDPGGFAIKRNPGATLLWTTQKYTLFGDGKGGVLIDIGEPESMEWYFHGRVATRAEVEHSVETGLPTLAEMAAKEPGATEDLLARKRWLEGRYPK